MKLSDKIFELLEKYIKFKQYFTRKYTNEEIIEEDKLNDGIVWYKYDEDQPMNDKLIGFDYI